MYFMKIKELNHLGIVAGLTKELGVSELINSYIPAINIEQECITTGEAVCAMVMNGLGFSDAPLSLTHEFFESKPMDLLFRPEVTAQHLNRHKLGRTLDQIHAFGCDRLFYLLASVLTKKEKIDTRFVSLDTTSINLTGEYNVDCDEHTVRITHGHSKDFRPDLKQVVQELLVSQDSGVPLMMKCWDGNASDNTIFKERAKILIDNFKESEEPRYLIADSKLYHKDNMDNLSALNFVTRIPSTLKEEQKSIKEAIAANDWQVLDEKNKFKTRELVHYDIAQRWMIVYSMGAKERAEKTLYKAVEKEASKLTLEIKKLSREGYGCAHDAELAVTNLMKKMNYHKIKQLKISEKKVYLSKGRPKKTDENFIIEHYITLEIEINSATIQDALEQRSCYVVGTNAASDQLTDKEAIEAYKRQNASIENMGFRFLKDPVFFTSSLFLKKPERIMALLFVMNLSLLIYALAQRRLRKNLEKHNETLPNQIQKPTQKITMRRAFQLLRGIYVVQHANQEDQIEGLTELKCKIIALMGLSIMKIYGIEINTFFCREG